MGFNYYILEEEKELKDISEGNEVDFKLFKLQFC